MTFKSKEQQRQYQREWIAARRAAYFADKSCAVCGSTDRLELDHIDPKTKLFNPASLWGMSDSNPNKIAELAKCQVLCHEHHIDKTSETRRIKYHGRTSYVSYGCRCQVCKNAHAAYNRKMRLNKKIR